VKALYTSQERVITVNKNPAYPKASKELKAAKKLPEIVKLRQIKSLNNIVNKTIEASNDWSNRRWDLDRSLAARRTIRGYEIMNMMQKGQVLEVPKGRDNSSKKKKY